MKKLIFVIVVIVLATLALWYGGGDKDGVLPDGGRTDGTAVEETFGGELYSGAGAGNPIERVPESNPFTKQINPFSEVRTNPF